MRLRCGNDRELRKPSFSGRWRAGIPASEQGQSSRKSHGDLWASRGEASSMKEMHERTAARVKTLGGVTIIRPQY